MVQAGWLAFAAAIGTVSASTPQATLQWITSSDPTLNPEQALDVSADGTWVVGVAGRRTEGKQGDEWHFVPFVWSQMTGLVELPLDPSTPDAWAWSISDDGRILGGAAPDPSDPFSRIGMRWQTSDFVTYALDQPLGRDVIMAFNSSTTAAVGYRYDGEWLPIRIDLATGSTGLALPDGADYAMARDIADDGTIVGWAVRHADTPELEQLAVIWRPDGTPEYITPPSTTPGTWSEANSITPDGRFIAGWSELGTRWSEALGWHDPTEYFPDGGSLDPVSVIGEEISSDGRFLVGTGHSENPCLNFGYPPAASVWFDDSGGTYLAQWLSAYFDLPPECLFDRVRCADDGRTIVGTGLGPGGYWQPFVLTLPPPCVADANGDKQVNGADLSLLLASFGRQSHAGLGVDLNHDGRVNNADLSILLFYFNDPC